MKHIEVYTTHNCPWCVRARALLESKGLDYEEINVASDTARVQDMIERSGRRTVPQVFIDGEAVGGFTELSALVQTGKPD